MAMNIVIGHEDLVFFISASVNRPEVDKALFQAILSGFWRLRPALMNFNNLIKELHYKPTKNVK